MNKRDLLYLSVILILLGALSSVLILKIVPPINQYKNYVISGEVIPLEKIIGVNPKYVYIYYPSNMPESLCRSSKIQLSAIEWLDENKGKYQILFTVPVGLDEIIITTDCSSCEYKKVRLDNIPESIDLMYGNAECKDDFQVSDQQPKVVEHARNFLNRIQTNIVDKPFNYSEDQSIKKDIERGLDEISESDSMRDNINESLLHAYYAEWFAYRAQYKLRFFELKYCVENINILFESHEEYKCFVPDYNTYNDYSSVNITYFSLRKSSLLDDSSFDKLESQKMKDEIWYLHRQVERISDSVNKCKNSQDIINGTFEFQKPYCIARKTAIYLFNFVGLIIIFGIGILIGQRWGK
ncbi:MAG: hypothetical protein KAT28_02540 [Candidatus Aenigmarchaeota archaeon]|nr:hypothetical protein [Candidatus Aenigmarchaeota archaeon]